LVVTNFIQASVQEIFSRASVIVFPPTGGSVVLQLTAIKRSDIIPITFITIVTPETNYYLFSLINLGKDKNQKQTINCSSPQSFLLLNHKTAVRDCL
jgi:hypothetical protein